MEVMPQNNTSFCGEVRSGERYMLSQHLLGLQPGLGAYELFPTTGSPCPLACCVLRLQVPSTPVYTQYLNPYLNQKTVDTPLVLPSCLPGTDQPGAAVPSPPVGPSPEAPPPPSTTESSSSSSDVGIIIGAIAGAVAAIGSLLQGCWGGVRRGITLCQSRLHAWVPHVGVGRPQVLALVGLSSMLRAIWGTDPSLTHSPAHLCAQPLLPSGHGGGAPGHARPGWGRCLGPKRLRAAPTFFTVPASQRACL